MGGDLSSSLLYTSPWGMQNDFDECIFFFIPHAPPDLWLARFLNVTSI